MLKRIWRVLAFIGFFIQELIRANWRVTQAVIRPERMRPGVAAIPLDLTSPAQITLLANLITLTPGTLALEVETGSPAGPPYTLYVHALALEDVAAFQQDIKQGFERRILEVWA